MADHSRSFDYTKLSLHHSRLVPFRSPLLRESQSVFRSDQWPSISQRETYGQRSELRNPNSHLHECCFLFLEVLRCFSSPGSHSSKLEYYPLRIVSCLIRKSPDHRKFDSSPRRIAVYCVLHRFSMSRHPPCALLSLSTT